MTHVFYDNVRETAVTTGTGNFATNGATTAVPTAVVGRTFSSIMATGDTFDYVIQHREANEWEVGKGTWLGSGTFSRDTVTASSNSNALVNFSSGTKVVWTGPTSSIRQYIANLSNIQTYGAVEGQDNTTPINAARIDTGVNRPVFAPSAIYSNDWGVKGITSLDFGADQLGEGSGFSLSQGTDATPSETSSPLIYLEKVTQGHPTNQNDHGALDIRVRKVGGSNNTYAVFAAAESAAGGGIVTPFFSIAKASDATATYVTGSRIYANKTVAMNAGVLTGMDILMADTSGQDNGWMDTNASGATTGISLINDPGRGTFGIRIATGSSGNGFYTGVLVDQDSVMPASFSGTAEAIRVKGESTGSKKYGGLWLQSGNFSYGINMIGPTFDNNCILVADKDTRIVFGADSSATSYVSWTSSDYFSVNQGSYAINGTKVLGSRITGWTTPSGTSTRSGYTTSTATAAQVGEALKALIEDLKTHGIIGT